MKSQTALTVERWGGIIISLIFLNTLFQTRATNVSKGYLTLSDFRNATDTQKQGTNLASSHCPSFRVLTWRSDPNSAPVQFFAGLIILKLCHHWPLSMCVNTQSICVSCGSDRQLL